MTEQTPYPDYIDQNTTVIEHSPVVKKVPSIKKPRKWRVIILNDDFTPMEFVVGVLVRYFSKSDQEAFEIMKLVHTTGKGTAGVFTHEVADSKITCVSEIARENQFPLRLIMEPVDE